MTGYHLAAIVSVPDSITRWRAAHAVNQTGAVVVFDATRRAGVPVVYASSAAVYGDPQGARCAEAQMPVPLSPYGVDKMEMKHHARAFGQIYGLPSVGLRPFNVYGPMQAEQSPYAGVIARFVDHLRAGAAHIVHGDGVQTRDFIHVTDVVAGFQGAMAQAQLQGRAQICNLATGQSVTLRALIDTLDQLTGRVTPVLFGAARVGDIRDSRADITRMQQLLPLLAPRPIGQGLESLLDGIRTG